MKILNYLFVAVIALILIFLGAIIIVGIFEEEKTDFGGLKEITGTMNTFEVSHGKSAYPPHYTTRDNDRYDEKFLDYLDGIQESRDNTFLR